MHKCSINEHEWKLLHIRCVCCIQHVLQKCKTENNLFLFHFSFIVAVSSRNPILRLIY